MDAWIEGINEPGDATDGDGTALVRGGFSVWILIDVPFLHIKWRLR